jgi:hypothetical protein
MAEEKSKKPRYLNVRCASNGFILEVNYHDSFVGPSAGEEPEVYVLTSLQDLIIKMRSLLDT